MGLNIKNDETLKLAGELARLTGDTMIGAITSALRERLERELRIRSAEKRLKKMRAIAERCPPARAGSVRGPAWRRPL